MPLGSPAFEAISTGWMKVLDGRLAAWYDDIRSIAIECADTSLPSPGTLMTDDQIADL
jgi:hypothetical protein